MNYKIINLNLKKVKNIAVTGGKSSNLNDKYLDIPVTKINEVEAIGNGVKKLYNTGDKPFVAISAGTGTACIYHSEGQFNYLGGISIGGGILQGLSKPVNDLSRGCSVDEIVNTVVVTANQVK